MRSRLAARRRRFAARCHTDGGHAPEVRMDDRDRDRPPVADGQQQRDRLAARVGRLVGRERQLQGTDRAVRFRRGQSQKCKRE